MNAENHWLSIYILYMCMKECRIAAILCFNVTGMEVSPKENGCSLGSLLLPISVQLCGVDRLLTAQGNFHWNDGQYP